MIHASVSSPLVAQARDPWAPYAENNGKGKGGDVVPESGSYGLILMALVLVVVFAARISNRNHNGK